MRLDRKTLTLASADQIVDRIVYLHEIHHAGLNDSTAWGTALHLFARLPEPHCSCFAPLLDAYQVAETGHDDVLDIEIGHTGLANLTGIPGAHVFGFYDPGAAVMRDSVIVGRTETRIMLAGDVCRPLLFHGYSRVKSTMRRRASRADGSWYPVATNRPATSAHTGVSPGA